MNPLQIIQIAQVCHAANAAYCLTLGDDSPPAWDDAPDWQKESAIAGVRFHIEHPDAGPEASHENWLAEKERTGWKYGPVKDPEKKEHPCFVPFDQLPAEQQRKDFIFRAIVHAYLCSHPGAVMRHDQQGFGGTIYVDRWAFFKDTPELFEQRLDHALADLREWMIEARRAEPEEPRPEAVR